MGQPISAFDFLAETGPLPPFSTAAVFGNEPFLRWLALRHLRQRLLATEGLEPDTPIRVYEGEEAQWRDVADELMTMSLFGGGGRRIVMVDDADKFVTNYRDKLEIYAGKAHKSSVLILVLDQLASNTKLAKLLVVSGLQVECRMPLSGKDPDVGRIAAWLVERAPAAHAAKIDRDAARLLVDLVGIEFGLLDQELEKLAIQAGQGGKITTDMVREFAGGWRLKSTWDLVDAALEGNLPEAMRLLDQMLQAGQEPIALMGGIAWSLRRMAAAARLFERGERTGERVTLSAALLEAGISKYAPLLAKAEKQLQQLGRQRAAALYRQLLDIDLSLKLTHSTTDRARHQIEQLFVRLSKQMDPRRAAARLETSRDGAGTR